MHLRATIAWATWVSLCACVDAEPTPAPSRASPPAPAPADWARAVQALPVERLSSAPRRDIRKAVMEDSAEGTDEPVAARRLVYRVAFVVPPSFRDRRAEIPAPASELEIDLSRDRLRARFVGPGWPVPHGAEVRLRTDLPGVYVFDDDGGRSLGPGELAAWFEGRPLGGSRSSARVRREPGMPNEGPSEPVCVLLAEWTARDRDDLLRRCGGGSIPPAFGFGPWRAELTAMVPLRLPRRALRADEIDPPNPIERVDSGATLAASDLDRLLPGRARFAAANHGALDVENQSDTRAIVLVEGVPIGWVDAAAHARFEGLRTGLHRIGALRPLGFVRVPPRPVQVPGTLLIGRQRDASAPPRVTTRVR